MSRRKYTMPIYEYGCRKCGHELSKMQKFSDAPLTECPQCSGELKKLISNTSFVLKGGGWYAEGYASSENKKAAVPEKKPAEAGACAAACGGACSAPVASPDSSSSKKDAAA
jgi:putative FmdB family regulatory protein